MVDKNFVILVRTVRMSQSLLTFATHFLGAFAAIVSSIQLSAQRGFEAIGMILYLDFC